nr:hypothetical protein Itr_chr08CG07110 [Ipomoea trifida]
MTSFKRFWIKSKIDIGHYWSSAVFAEAEQRRHEGGTAPPRNKEFATHYPCRQRCLIATPPPLTAIVKAEPPASSDAAARTAVAQAPPPPLTYSERRAVENRNPLLEGRATANFRDPDRTPSKSTWCHHQ